MRDYLSRPGNAKHAMTMLTLAMLILLGAVFMATHAGMSRGDIAGAEGTRYLTPSLTVGTPTLTVAPTSTPTPTSTPVTLIIEVYECPLEEGFCVRLKR